MNACKGYAAGRIWLQVALVEGRAGKGADKKPHGPGRMFVFQWGMTLGYWARAWPLNTGEQGRAADPYLSPFDFLFIIRSIHLSHSLAFHPLLTLHLSLSQPLSLSLSSFSGEQCVFSLRQANVITRASNWWQFSMGALRQHCVGCGWAVAKRMCVFVVVQ